MSQRPPQKHIRAIMPFLALLLISFSVSGQAPAPMTADDYYQQGVVQNRAGDDKKAAESYRQALKLDSKHFGAQFNLGTTYLSLKQFEDAVSAFRAAVAHKPLDAIVQVELGRAYALAGRDFEAIDAFKEAHRLEPDLLEAELGLGAIYAKLGRIEEAQVPLLRAIQKHDRDVRIHLQLGEIYLRAQWWNQAINSFSRLLALNPDFSVGHQLLGAAYNGAARYAEAALEFRQAVRLDPRDDLAFFNLGSVLRQLGLIDEAINAFKSAVALKPTSTAYVELGELYSDKSEYALAEAALKEGLRTEPNDNDGLEALANVYLKTSRNAEALEPLRKLVALTPNDAERQLLLGNTYMMTGQYDQAVASLNTSLRLRPANELAQERLRVATARKELSASLMKYRQDVLDHPKDAEAHVELGKRLNSVGLFEEAESELLMALKLAPDSWQYENQLAINYVEWGKVEKAIEYYRLAIKHHPHEVFYYVLGQQLLYSGKIDQAIAAFRSSVELKPTFALPWFELGKIYYTRGDYAESITVLRKALEINPTDPFVVHALAFAYLGAGDRDAARQQYNILKDLDPRAAADLLQAISR